MFRYHSCTNSTTRSHGEDIKDCRSNYVESQLTKNVRYENFLNIVYNSLFTYCTDANITFRDKSSNNINEQFWCASGCSHKCCPCHIVGHIQSYVKEIVKISQTKLFMMNQPVHIFSTAGTKYLSQTTASAKNKYKLQIAWSTTAPDCRCCSVKKSLGKSSIAGCVQFGPRKCYKIMNKLLCFVNQE